MKILKEMQAKQSAGALILALSIIGTALSGCAAPEVKPLALSCSYAIDAKLDPENKTLLYTQQAQVRNDGEGSTKELCFHLHGNMYKTDDASIQVASILDDSGSSLAFKMENDDQLIRLTLNEALDSGGETTLTFTCEATIPVMTDRYGIARDGEIQMSLFYPQLAVYDENGWDAEPMNGVGDGRYAGMSDYMLAIEAPSEYQVACSGTELSREIDGELTTYVFQADARRDIIFTAYTDYARLERTVGDTTIIGYFNSGKSRASMEQVMDAAAFSMEYYSRIYMEYPYDTLVITSGGWATKISLSMEYSGFFTVSMYEEPNENNIINTYHEMAHQWFYFLVGNDENAEPWLDESFATFSAGLCFEETDAEYGELYWEMQRSQSNAVADERLNCAHDETGDYSLLFYGRGACFLKDLTDAIGKDAFLPILSDYCRTYAYKIATTEGFLNILREQTPVSVEEIIEQYIA